MTDGPHREPKTATMALAAMLCLLIAVCFFPLSQLFFSQDDLQLVYEAVGDLPGNIEKAFSRANSYHFRPLTKHVYFFAMFHAFGLNAQPFHLVSLLLHILNTLLVFALLRRFRVPPESAITAAACFGLNAAYFHAVGWISCIQQLMPTAFSLGSILTGLIALERLRSGSPAALWSILSAIAYLGALMGNEQSYGVPVLTVAASTLRLTGSRDATRSMLSVVGPQVILMIAYLAARFLWMGLPRTGISRFVYGPNVGENLVAYLGAYFDWWPRITTVITLSPLTLRPSHVTLAFFVAYQLVRRRFGLVAFALLAMLGALTPTIFQNKHYFFYHTYIAGIGVACLVSGPIQDALAALRTERNSRTVHIAASSALVLALFAGAARSVRNNIAVASNVHPRKYSGSFVVRRAEIASNAYTTWANVRPAVEGATTINLVYRAPEMQVKSSRRRSAGQHGEVVWSLGQGRAINVFLGDYTVEVNMGTASKSEGKSVLIYYDSVGNLRTPPPDD